MPSDTEDDLTVPEITAANPDGGAADLNADPITQSISDSIDHALDEAEGLTAGEDNSSDTFGQQGSRYERNIQKQEQPAKQDEPDAFPANFGTNPGTNQQTFESEIPMPPNMSEKQQSNWRKMSEALSSARKQAAEAEILRQRLAETQQQLPPDYDELKRFRATFDLQNDPGFKAKYDAPLKERKDRIYDLLRKHKAGDDVINSIEAAGGPGKVSLAWWKANAIDRLASNKDGFIDARRLENALLEIDDIEQSRQRDIEESSKNQEAWMQQREQEREAQFYQESQEVYGYVENITKNVPWARYQEIPPGATQEQVQRIQAHNAGVKDLETKFNSALYPKTASDRAAIASAATLSHVLTNQLRYEQSTRAKLQAQVAQLNKELSAIKGAGRMPRNTVAGQSSVKGGSMADRLKMSSSDAIDAGLDEAGI